MVAIETITHPAVELDLLLDGDDHEYEVPHQTTLFLWSSLAVGTEETLPPIHSSRGSSLFATGEDVQGRIDCQITVEGRSLPLVADSYYRVGDYKGFAWWIAFDPETLPVSIDVSFETYGEQPTANGESLVFWTRQGRKIAWGEAIESTLTLVPSEIPRTEFPTRCEPLWGRHTVLQPHKVR